MWKTSVNLQTRRYAELSLRSLMLGWEYYISVKPHIYLHIRINTQNRARFWPSSVISLDLELHLLNMATKWGSVFRTLTCVVWMDGPLAHRVWIISTNGAHPHVRKMHQDSDQTRSNRKPVSLEVEWVSTEKSKSGHNLSAKAKKLTPYNGTMSSSWTSDFCICNILHW